MVLASMADPLANSGIRADGSLGRSVATLKSDNYTSWSSRLKAVLKISDCWRLTTGVELLPAVAAAGSTAAQVAAADTARASWLKRKDRTAAVLIMSISDEEHGTVQAVDEDPVEIWKRLKEKFDRTSEAEAETAHI